MNVVGDSAASPTGGLVKLGKKRATIATSGERRDHSLR
jgi:hypothetical protein